MALPWRTIATLRSLSDVDGGWDKTFVSQYRIVAFACGMIAIGDLIAVPMALVPLDRSSHYHKSDTLTNSNVMVAGVFAHAHTHHPVLPMLL